MNRSAKFLIGTFCVVFGVYAFLQYWHPTVVINYRLTIDAVTPDGPKTGSGVIQVSYASQFNLNGGGRRGVIEVTGEAVPVDLGHGKMLFVTLTCQASGRGCNSVGLDTAHDAEWLPVRVFGFDWNWGDERTLARQVAAAKSAGPREVPLQALPTIVTFKDINDPKSAVLVQPDNLAATFGETYSLSKAILELTDELPRTDSLSQLGFALKLRTQATLSGLERFDPKMPEGINYLTTDAFSKQGTQ